MLFVLVLIQGVIFGLFCSFIAGQKSRDKGNWFILGFLFSFLALIALAAIPPVEVKRPFAPDDEDVNRKCPFCAETLKREAIICRFCQRDLPLVETKPNSDKTKNDAIAPALQDELTSADEKQRAVGMNRQEIIEANHAAYLDTIHSALNDPTGKLINAFDADGRTPLMNAIQRKDIKTIKALLTANAKTNQFWKNPISGDYVSIKELAKQASPEIYRLLV